MATLSPSRTSASASNRRISRSPFASKNNTPRANTSSTSNLLIPPISSGKRTRKSIGSAKKKHLPSPITKLPNSGESVASQLVVENKTDSTTCTVITATTTKRPQEFVDQPANLAMNSTPNIVVEESKALAAFRELTLEEQNQRIFASKSEALADALAEYCEQGIAQGVQSLPLLTNTSKAEQLQATLKDQYLWHIDILEVYANKNLFTLRQLSPHLRACLLQDYQVHPEPREPTTSTTIGDDNSDTAPKSLVSKDNDELACSVNPTSRDEIPSAAAIKELDEELEALTQAIHEAESRRDHLRVQAISQQQALSLLDKAEQATQALVQTPAEVETAVTTAVMGGQGLRNLQAESRASEKALESKRGNTGVEDDENEDDPFQASRRLPNKRPKKLTLEESYQLEKQVLGVGGSIDQLNTLANRLRQQPK